MSHVCFNTCFVVYLYSWEFYLYLIVVFKHEGLRSALDQVKQTASDARRNKYVLQSSVWTYYVVIVQKSQRCNKTFYKNRTGGPKSLNMHTLYSDKSNVLLIVLVSGLSCYFQCVTTRTREKGPHERQYLLLTEQRPHLLRVKRWVSRLSLPTAYLLEWIVTSVQAANCPMCDTYAGHTIITSYSLPVGMNCHVIQCKQQTVQCCHLHVCRSRNYYFLQRACWNVFSRYVTYAFRLLV